MAVDARDWARSLYATLDGDRTTAAELRQASLAEDLAGWTEALTGLVAQSLRGLGLEVAAKGHRCTALPVERQEYLALDVTAFSEAGSAWRFPVAVCELENSARDEVVAYALWKDALHPARAARGLLLPERARRCTEADRGALRPSGRRDGDSGSRTSERRHARVRRIEERLRYVPVRLLSGLAPESEPRPVRDLRVAGIV